MTSLGYVVDEGQYNHVFLGNASMDNIDASDPPAYPTAYLAVGAFHYISISSSTGGCPQGWEMSQAGNGFASEPFSVPLTST